MLAVASLILTAFGTLRIDGRLLWPLFAFYGLHLLGMLWTTNRDFGFFDLQIKLGLVLLPIAASAYTAVTGATALRKSMSAFSLGTILAVCLSMVKALGCFGEKGWIECFTQSYLSFDLHPSYAAWYAVWALAYWSNALIRGEVPGRWRWAVIAFLVVALAFSVMLASKSGLLCLVVVLIMLVALIVLRMSGALRWKVLGALAVVVAVPSVLLAPVIGTRTGAAIGAMQRTFEGNEDIYAGENGNDERLVAWLCSAELIRHDPIGAGTGDIKDALVSCYEARGAKTAAVRRLNSHDQFLQSGVALGWAGLLAALLVALVPLWFAIRRGDLLLGVFMVLFVLNATVESVLEVQAGVVFFALFLGLLAVRHRSSPA